MTACWHGKLERCDDCPKPQGYIPEGGVWTQEEMDAWKHGVLGRVGTDETAILDVRSGELTRIVNTVAALLAALKDLSAMAEPFYADDTQKCHDADALIAALEK